MIDQVSFLDITEAVGSKNKETKALKFDQSIHLAEQKQAFKCKPALITNCYIKGLTLRQLTWYEKVQRRPHFLP